jgi:ABC-2 type transport system permease protein
MNLRRIRAVAQKETLHVIRDPRALGIGIAIPMLLLLLFGYALTLDVDRVPLAVWDQSHTPESRELLSRFTGSRYFELTLAADGYAQLERALDRRDALLALVIPSTFAGDVAAGRPTSVQVVADGSDPNTATLALNYADVAVRGYSGAVLQHRALRSGIAAPFPPLDLRPRVWFNDDLDSRFFIVPGLIAVIMMIIGGLLTSLTVAREWETGTMEQLLSTPVRPAELILGKLVPYFVIGMLDLTLSVAAGRFLFGVPIRGSLLFLFAISSVFLAVALGLGILISAVAKQQLLASQVAFVVTFLPAFLLSGFMTDTANMPPPLQAISRLVPARYFVTLLRGLTLKGAGPRELATEVLLLVAFATGVLLLAIRAMKKRIG